MPRRTCRTDPLVIQPMTRRTADHDFEGNARLPSAEDGRRHLVAWYPSTPSSSLCESLIDYLKKVRRDPRRGSDLRRPSGRGRDRCARHGDWRGWMGARSIRRGRSRHSLMSNSRAGYYAEVPAVIFDVQRVGPSTGLPAHRTAGRPFHCGPSHGDTSTRCSFRPPSASGYSLALDAFDLADRLQTPCCPSDLDLG